MAKKVLNLDEVLQTEARELVLNGVTYQVTEMTVEDYVQATKAGEKLAGNTDTELQMNETARLIVRQIPGIDVAFLMSLSVERMYAIAEFVRGVDPEAIVARALKDTTPETPAVEGEAGKE